MLINGDILFTMVKEALQMLELPTRILQWLGVTIHVTKRPLTEDEWERARVLPLYQASLAEAADDDILDPAGVEAFLRGEKEFSEIPPQSTR